MGATAAFVREFLKSPTTTAAIGPSSRFLAAEMVAPIPATGDPVVVELGPGTGAFTGVIQGRLGGRGRHVALELNPRWAVALGDRYPAVETVCADARELPAVLAERGIRADVIISGLPWAAHAAKGGRPLTAILAESLTGSGVVTQFAYTFTRWAPPARQQLRDLRESFEETVISRTVWRNVPPAVVYFARRPRLTAGAENHQGFLRW